MAARTIRELSRAQQPLTAVVVTKDEPLLVIGYVKRASAEKQAGYWRDLGHQASIGEPLEDGRHPVTVTRPVRVLAFTGRRDG